MNRIKLGLIGAGIIMRENHVPALKALDTRYEIVAVCSRTEENARKLAELVGCSKVHTDYCRLLAQPDIEAVDIAVPIYMNHEVSLAAAQAGKHVICEKPIASNLRDAAAMIELPNDYGIVYLIAENFRYTPDFRRVREWVRAGAIGKPLLGHWELVSPFDPYGKYVRTEWRQKPAHLGGYISDGGVHYIDVLRGVFGEVEQVQAFMTQTWPLLGSYDTAVINLQMAGRVPVNLTLSWATTQSAGSGLEVFGQEGAISSNRDETVLRRPGAPDERFVGPDTGGFLEEFIDFHLAITEGKSLEMTPHDAFFDLAVTAAAVESAEKNQVIDFGDFLSQQGGS